MNNLKERDKAILQHLRDGLIIKEIAQRLNVSESVVNKCVWRLKKKNEAKSTVQLVAKFVSLNLL